jgi:hypothetical protein
MRTIFVTFRCRRLWSKPRIPIARRPFWADLSKEFRLGSSVLAFPSGFVPCLPFCHEIWPSRETVPANCFFQRYKTTTDARSLLSPAGCWCWGATNDGAPGRQIESGSLMISSGMCKLRVRHREEPVSEGMGLAAESASSRLACPLKGYQLWVEWVVR